MKDTPHSFGWISITLHWLCAILILFLFGLGLYMSGLDYYSPWYHRAPELHIAAGISVFLLMAMRILWRINSAAPNALVGQTYIALVAAKAVKLALYALVFLVCLTGYLITTAEGKGAHFYNWFEIPALGELPPTYADLAKEIHEYAAWGIIGLVVLHAGAALLHHFILRDKTLLRMLKPQA